MLPLISIVRSPLLTKTYCKNVKIATTAIPVPRSYTTFFRNEKSFQLNYGSKSSAFGNLARRFSKGSRSKDDLIQELLVEQYGKEAATAALKTLSGQGEKKEGDIIIKTPQDLHKYIMGLEETPQMVRKPENERLKPTKLAISFTSTPIGIGPSLKEAYDSFSYRLDIRTKGPVVSESRNNPLTAVYSSPGAGKSFFLDQLAALDAHHIETHCKDPKMQEILKNSMAVTVTYNSKTTVSDFDWEKGNHVLGFCLRILYSFYYTDTSSYDKFVARMKPAYDYIRVDPVDTIRCLFHALEEWNTGKTGIVLCVDEIMKLNQQVAETVLSQGIGKFLNENSLGDGRHVNICVTTLNQDVPTFHEARGSKRPVLWVTLPRPTVEQLLPCFPFQTRDLRMCISDCNGHFRSLQNLHKICTENQTRKDITYPELITLLTNRMRTLSYLQADDFSVIKTALKGEIVKSLLDVHQPTGKTYDQLISSSYLLTPETEKGFIPSVSPLMLNMFATKPGILSKEEMNISACIRKMLFNDYQQFYWRSYEKFHAHWEVLYRLLWKGTLQSVHSMYLKTDQPNSPTFVVTDKPSKVKEYDEIKANLQLTIPQLLKEVAVPGENNPGFDLVTCERTVDGNSIAIAVECKYSAPDSGTTLSPKHIEDKKQLTDQYFEKHVSDVEMKRLAKEKRVFLVFCAWRNATEEAPDNCIVLDREDLKKLYTPTLSNRPQFLSDEEEANPQQAESSRKSQEELDRNN